MNLICLDLSESFERIKSIKNTGDLKLERPVKFTSLGLGFTDARRAFLHNENWKIGSKWPYCQWKVYRRMWANWNGQSPPNKCMFTILQIKRAPNTSSVPLIKSTLWFRSPTTVPNVLMLCLLLTSVSASDHPTRYFILEVKISVDTFRNYVRVLNNSYYQFAFSISIWIDLTFWISIQQ